MGIRIQANQNGIILRFEEFSQNMSRRKIIMKKINKLGNVVETETI
jgi:hypothetical protein